LFVNRRAAVAEPAVPALRRREAMIFQFVTRDSFCTVPMGVDQNALA
jgi:hypothetical protein